MALSLLWITLVVVTLLTTDSDFLYVPYGDYVTTVTLTEDRGSGCGRHSDVWSARDLAGRQVKVCDQRLFVGFDVGDVVPVGSATWWSHLGRILILGMLLAGPGAFVLWLGAGMVRRPRRWPRRPPGRFSRQARRLAGRARRWRSWPRRL